MDNYKEYILVLNSGSSSIKFSIFDQNCNSKGRGLIENINTGNKVRAKYHILDESKNIYFEEFDFVKSIKWMFDLLKEKNILDSLIACGHRVVHGGEYFSESVIIDSYVEDKINLCASMAPIHNPVSLNSIKIIKSLLPDIVQIASFDTAFHQTLPKYVYTYPIPYRFYEENSIRKYGFHGNSHKYVLHKMASIMGKNTSETSLISVHLGNGASVTSISNGKSMDTSMGFTPMEGLIMGTRAGFMDPGLFYYIVQTLDIAPKDLDNILLKESGLLGISGVSSDMREVVKAADEGDERASLAVEMFCYKAAKSMNASLSSLKALDGIVFTGGIGENSGVVRSKILDHMAIIGIEYDHMLNEEIVNGKTGEITRMTSRYPVWVIPSNEELMIAKDVLHLVPNI